ncbi:Methyltransferase domain-containing protein [Gammaproteobacteria bacterium]
MNDDEFLKHAIMEDDHWWFRARRELLWQLVARRIYPLPQRLLEIGCGTGGNLLFLKNYIPQVTGIDPSPLAARLAQQRTGLDIRHGNFQEIPIHEWQTIELVLLADVLEHVENDQAFLYELWSRMADESYLLLTVPAHSFLWSNHDICLGHYRRYAPGQLIALFAELPAQILVSRPLNTLLFPAIAGYRLLSREKERPASQSDFFSMPAWLNTLLWAIFRLEGLWFPLRLLPMGVSHVLLVRKRSTS